MYYELFIRRAGGVTDQKGKFITFFWGEIEGSYLEIRMLRVGACVLDPQIQLQMRLENFTG